VISQLRIYFDANADPDCSKLEIASSLNRVTALALVFSLSRGAD
jgi:hypothetical protein